MNEASAMWFPQVIAIAGFATSGKDAAADHLVARWGYRKVGWADKLREAASALNPIVGFEHVEGQGPVEVRYCDVVDRVGYQAAKFHPHFGEEFRRTLIRLGTEVGREVLGPDTWVDALLRDVGSGPVVIPDTRFPNEARAVFALGGIVIRIKRPGVEAFTDHPSETALVDWEYDAVIVNDGTLADLGAKLDACLMELAERGAA